MKIVFRALAVAACFGFALTALPAQACSRTLTSVDAFVYQLKQYHTFVRPGFGQPVIFRGVVESVAKSPHVSKTEGADRERHFWDVQFKSVHWYGSMQQVRQATVLAFARSQVDAFCEVHSFRAEAGEEWLIFGYRQKDGKFLPDTDVSLRIKNGLIPPPEILRQLP